MNERLIQACVDTQNWLADSLENMTEEDKALYDAEFGEGAWQEDFGDV